MEECQYIFVLRASFHIEICVHEIYAFPMLEALLFLFASLIMRLEFML